VTAPQTPGPEHGPAVRYEKQDVEPRAVVRFAAILGVFTLITCAALLPVFGWLRAREAGQDPPAPPMGRQPPGTRQAPEPRLQVAPPAELHASQRDADRVLTSYGWVDEEKGIVRIPIDDAMRLLVERSAAPAPPSPSPTPVAPAGAARPGRTP
jgi:hypothetical protein